jgi:uncharacterized cupredoxin-like copper-binding protein
LPHRTTLLRSIATTLVFVLALWATVAAGQPEEPGPPDDPSALVRNAALMSDDPSCALEERDLSVGRTALRRDSTADDVDVEIEPPSPSGPSVEVDGAIDAVPSSAAEACATAHRGTTAVEQATDEPPLATVDVEARDLWFKPAALTVSGSEHRTIRLKNAGRVVHNLTVDELGIVIVVTPGEVGEAILTDIEPGTYAYYCSISGHQEAGMVGTLTVQ